MNIILYFIFFFLFTTSSIAIDTKAGQAIVVDYNTNEILFEKHADQKIPPASMTKIMTAYVTFDRILKTDLSIDDYCIVSKKAYKMGGSRTFLEIGDKITINQILKGIIIQSGNDASVAIAECLAGTEDDFAKLMNVYSNKLGLKNTNFINSSGWPDKNHYSTVRDLAILSNSIIRDFPNLYKYFNENEFTYNNIKQPNRNRLLINNEGSDGLKTGYTKKSGWGISGSAKRNGRRITVVINNANSPSARFTESSNLINWAFSQTSVKKLLNKDQIIKNVDVWLGTKPTVNLIIEKDIISILSYDQMQLIESHISYEKPIEAPIKKGEKLGTINIKIPNKKIIIIPLVAESDVKEINPLFKIFAAIKYLIFGNSLDEI